MIHLYTKFQFKMFIGDEENEWKPIIIRIFLSLFGAQFCQK